MAERRRAAQPARPRRRGGRDTPPRARGRARVRLILAAPIPAGGARRHRRGRPLAAHARRRRRRQGRPRPGLGPAGVAVPEARALLPLPGSRIRVPSRSAGAPRRAARRGARLAARRAAATDRERPVVVVSAVALSEKVPDPALRPHSFTLRVGELLDLEECAKDLVGAGYERVDQVQERGQFALRGGLLDVFPRPRTAPCGSTCSTSRSNRCAGSQRSRSARSAR